MWFKKSITKQDMGQALWKLCCDFSEDFCTTFRPKFQANGYLQDATKDRAFISEAIIVHFCLIWYTLIEEQEVLKVFNGFHNSWLITMEPRLVAVMQKRIETYFEAMAIDEELLQKGLLPGKLAITAVDCLLNEGKPHEANVSFTLSNEVQLSLWSTIPSIRKFRDEFTIR
jgi:hypothetical protein